MTLPLLRESGCENARFALTTLLRPLLSSRVASCEARAPRGLLSFQEISDVARRGPRDTVIVDGQVTGLLLRSPVKLRRSDISLTGGYLDTPIQGPGTPIWVLLERATHVFAAQAKVAYMVPHLGMGVASLNLFLPISCLSSLSL